jgi:hypothetical protein
VPVWGTLEFTTFYPHAFFDLSVDGFGRIARQALEQWQLDVTNGHGNFSYVSG